MVILLLLLFPPPQDSTPTDKQARTAVRKFHILWANSNEDARIRAIRDLACVKHPRVASTLKRLLTRESVSVRIVAARVLGGFERISGVKYALYRAFHHRKNQSKSTRGVRITLIRSLAQLKTVEATRLMERHLGDRDAWVAKAAIDATQKLRQKSSVGALIVEYRRLMGKSGVKKLGADPLGEDSLPTASLNATNVLTAYGKPKDGAPKSRRQLLVPEIQKSLTSLTNKDFGSVGEWERWWRQNRSRFHVAQ